MKPQEEDQPAAEAPETPIPELKGEGGKEEPKREDAEELRKKVQSYWEQIVRLQAEFTNYRKRAEKERAEAVRFGREAILERLIGLYDVLEQALHHAQNASDLSSLKKGFEMAVREFGRFLKTEGVESLKSVGEPFDPHLHEALDQVPTEDESEHNRILEEIQKGYQVHGRLLRPARVKVARKAPPPPEGNAKEGKPDLKQEGPAC